MSQVLGDSGTEARTQIIGLASGGGRVEGHARMVLNAGEDVELDTGHLRYIAENYSGQALTGTRQWQNIFLTTHRRSAKTRISNHAVQGASP
jgi:hypothetical protein